VVLQIFFPKSENSFKRSFSRVKASGYPSGDFEAKTPQNFAPQKPASKLFSDSRKKSLKTTVSWPSPKFVGSARDHRQSKNRAQAIWPKHKMFWSAKCCVFGVRLKDYR
jgi:hypothetical protein